MILKAYNINSCSQYFYIEGSLDLRFLKVGLDSKGLVLYYMDYCNDGNGVHYNGTVIREGDDIYITPQMKCIGVEAGCAVFIEDFREVKLNTDTIVNELECRASSGGLANFVTYLLRSYEEDLVSNVLSRLESKDLSDLQ